MRRHRNSCQTGVADCNRCRVPRTRPIGGGDEPAGPAPTRATSLRTGLGGGGVAGCLDIDDIELGSFAVSARSMGAASTWRRTTKWRKHQAKCVRRAEIVDRDGGGVNSLLGADFGRPLLLPRAEAGCRRMLSCRPLEEGALLSLRAVQWTGGDPARAASRRSSPLCLCRVKRPVQGLTAREPVPISWTRGRPNHAALRVSSSRAWAGVR